MSIFTFGTTIMAEARRMQGEDSPDYSVTGETDHDGICTCGQCIGVMISPLSLDMSAMALENMERAASNHDINSDGHPERFDNPNTAAVKISPPDLIRLLKGEQSLRGPRGRRRQR
jgi:hypothetical protein